MKGFEVDHESLAGSGKDLTEAATTFSDALTAFQAKIEGFGRPWGDNDDIGMLIGTAHDEVSAWAFECYTTGVEEVLAAGEDLTLMSENYKSVETDVTDSFKPFVEGLGA